VRDGAAYDHGRASVRKEYLCLPRWGRHVAVGYSPYSREVVSSFFGMTVPVPVSGGALVVPAFTIAERSLA